MLVIQHLKVQRMPSSTLALPVILVTPSLAFTEWPHWVDDGLIQGPQDSVDAFKSAVSNAFKVTLGGPATCFLSMEIVRDQSNRTVLLKQPQKIAELATHYFWDF